jgi:hypothetical protein
MINVCWRKIIYKYVITGNTLLIPNTDQSITLSFLIWQFLCLQICQ